jgi:hypothetical protein
MLIVGFTRKSVTRHSASLIRRLSAYFMLMATVQSIALAPDAAGDHDTVGGGRFEVSNSDGSCTEFRIGTQPYESCPGSFVNVPPNGGDYLVVPLGFHASVSCETYAPDGSLFEHDTENSADVPGKQVYWAQQGWGPYKAEALCQLW